ncbi:MAG: hypothetical protein HUK16_04370 [Bacteroidales bacterium]|nr:hypothetical protein [Bacteroidales bacterium]
MDTISNESQASYDDRYEWCENPQVIASIQRGETDITNGRAVEMTAIDVRNLLGLNIEK